MPLRHITITMMTNKTEIQGGMQTSRIGPIPLITSRIAIAITLATLTSGCGTNMPIQKNGNTGEYVLNRDDKSPFGNLPSVKRSVSADAASFCAAMNKKYVEKYSIDKERAVFVWPESTLYFECVESGQEASVKRAPPKGDTESQQGGSVYSELIKLDELRKKGILTEAEFEGQKQKLLGNK